MKFSQLNNDILNILQSSDYNLYLELYNDECNTVMDKDETRWCYINDYNIMIKLPSEFDKNVTIIKNGDDLDNKMKRIISRMRKISVLNGVSVQIKVYNELDRRKIYNFIKTDIKKKKENMDMKESFDKSLITKTFYKMLKTAKQTNRSEDYYISESLKSQKNLNLLKEMICEVQNLESLKGVELNDFFASFLSCSSLKEIKNLVNKTSNLECVYESLDNINNLTKFVRSRYVNMGSNHKSSNTLFFMENVKVYTEKIMLSEQDVAYSILLNKSNGNVSYNNLLKIIKPVLNATKIIPTATAVSAPGNAVTNSNNALTGSNITPAIVNINFLFIFSPPFFPFYGLSAFILMFILLFFNILLLLYYFLIYLVLSYLLLPFLNHPNIIRVTR